MIFIDEKGYEQAKDHYMNLKKKMLDQVMKKTKKDDLLQLSKEDLSMAILQNTTNYWQANALGTEQLDMIETVVNDLILYDDNGTLSDTKKVLKSIEDKVKSLNGDEKEQLSYLKKLLKEEQDLIFKTIGFDKKFLQQWIQETTASTETSDIINQLSSYLVRFLYGQLNKSFKSIHRTKYALSLAGFYKEAMEYEVLHKALSNTINVFHAGSKNTELDILITNLDNLDDALLKNTTLNKTLYNLDNALDESLKSLYQSIDWFGEQVKSWRLSSHQDVYKIGNRAELYQQFLTEEKSTVSYNTLSSAKFLARFKNILLSLGPANVLFSSGSLRQWTCDFIADFRAANYYLAFGRSSNDKPLTQTVVLEQAYTAARKEVRARFRQNLT